MLSDKWIFFEFNEYGYVYKTNSYKYKLYFRDKKYEKFFEITRYPSWDYWITFDIKNNMGFYRL